MEHYIVKVHGEYFASTGERKELRGYKAVFKLPDASEPLGIVKGKLLMPYLRKKDPQVYAVHTHYIDEIASSDGRPIDPDALPIRFQTREQLRLYIKKHKLQISVEDYTDLGILRDHVRLAKEEPDNSKTIFEKYAKKRSAEKALFELNADVFDEGEANIPLDVAAGGSGNIAPEVPKTKTEDLLS